MFGHPLALHVTPDDVGDRVTVARLAADVQDATGETAASAAAAKGIALHVVKLPAPKRWVVERSFAWATHCRRWVKDYERYASTLTGFMSSRLSDTCSGTPLSYEGCITPLALK